MLVDMGVVVEEGTVMGTVVVVGVGTVMAMVVGMVVDTALDMVVDMVVDMAVGKLVDMIYILVYNVLGMVEDMVVVGMELELKMAVDNMDHRVEHKLIFYYPFSLT